MSGAKVVLPLLAFSLCIQSFSAEEVHVSIKNRLGEGKTMSIHCQSKDNDLGNHTVADGGKFGWDFSPNIWGTTLFYCDLAWDRVGEYHFDAYNFGRDSGRCKSQCLWLVAREGVYGLNGETNLWEFMYNWPS
ncbi:hypothetical protein U1Q18_027672 [Sarracenia purpurea var. burkii]